MSINCGDDLNQLLTQEKPVAAIVMQQFLRPITGDVIYPPTYAGTPDDPKSRYNLNKTRNGFIATIDSIPSQANRIEPLFMSKEFSALVPQIQVIAGDSAKNLLEMGHRLADAAIRFTTLNSDISAAFNAYKLQGNATPLAKLSPTSLIFGAWDSRAIHTQTKIPRIFTAEILATDVEELTNRFSTFNAVFDYNQLGLSKDEASSAGFSNALGSALGGVIVHGQIKRTVSLNLSGLKQLKGEAEQQTHLLQAYLLGLGLIALFVPINCDLRQGCHLVPDAQKTVVKAVLQDGSDVLLNLDFADIKQFAIDAAHQFGVGENKNIIFDTELMQQLLSGAKEKKESKGKAKKAKDAN